MQVFQVKLTDYRINMIFEYKDSLVRFTVDSLLGILTFTDFYHNSKLGIFRVFCKLVYTKNHLSMKI